MAKELKILIPDTDEQEAIDIRVMKANTELVSYRLEVFHFNSGQEQKSRAEFVKAKIEQYPSDFEVVEIGLDGEQNIPVLFRHLNK
jgi:hypothetical protein